MIWRWVVNTLLKEQFLHYDFVWKQILNTQDQAFLLPAVRDLFLKMQKTVGGGTVHQRHKEQPSPRFRLSLRLLTLKTDEGAVGRHQPLVCSLDQLFNQAAALDPFLRQKVKELALMSKGGFPVATKLDGLDAITHQRWEDILKNREAYRVMWARIKPTERALEKLIRSYDCDVSRLLDCCRQSIVFERLEDLLCCLQAIDCDEELQIVRLKNRLEESYDALVTGGYR
jgi:hypothetical protein